MTNQPLTNPGFSPDDFVRGYLTAFGKLYASYHAGLLRFARELVQDPSISENIVTDSFLKAWIICVDRLQSLCGNPRVFVGHGFSRDITAAFSNRL